MSLPDDTFATVRSRPSSASQSESYPRCGQEHVDCSTRETDPGRLSNSYCECRTGSETIAHSLLQRSLSKIKCVGLLRNVTSIITHSSRVLATVIAFDALVEDFTVDNV